MLVLSQVYVPDPTSVGQHLADACAEMVRRGWRVVVVTARDGYDDPSVHYPSRDTIHGVEVVRLRWCSFGKSSTAIRMLAGLSFVVQSVLRSLLVGRVDLVLVSTVPPIAPLAGIGASILRRAPVKYWVMDLNPDQMVELGKLPATSPWVRLFDWMNRRILGRATEVIVLDRFMAKRVLKKRDVRDKLTVLPPWPHEDHLEPVAHESNPFRTQHGLQGKLVVMYSGNHGHSTPLTTVLKAAAHLQDEDRLVFMFIGGGVGKKEVEATRLPNVRSLPYQPLETLRYSLSAADVHLVSLGDEVVGVVHPCKVYGAMAVARPIVLLGPEESHIGDLLHRDAFGWAIRHGDVEGATAFFRKLLTLPREELVSRGLKARAIITRELSKAALCAAFCDVLDRDGVAAVRETAFASRS
ncbi:MAG TPA: glycosyltransferase family 4 protein [Candidatus Eisenbacteria bacterium]|nr:glycosyltransferase family 4 protein [Candidatus Eisenbacteria bacterium]